MKYSQDNFSPTSNSVLLDSFRDYLTQSGKSPHTLKAYLSDTNAFVKWYELTLPTETNFLSANSQDIIGYKNRLLRDRRKASTINRQLKSLRFAFLWAIKKGFTNNNPFEVLEKVFIREQKEIAPRWLNSTETSALLRAVRRGENKRDIAIIQTLLGTGVRIAELAALEVDDLVMQDRSGWVTVLGKGMKTRRIPLDFKTRQALSDYMKDEEINEGKVFTGQRGPITVAGIDRLIHKYSYQAKLVNVTAHKLRHTFAKNLVDTGTPLDQVAALLGHESLDTTRIYTRPSEQDLEQAVRRAAGEI